MSRMTNLYQINGNPLPVPDEDVVMSFEDLDGADSGRDEGGWMHRIVVRHKVKSWSFQYKYLTQAQYAALLQILPEAGCFTFTYPSPSDCTQSEQTTAYLSKYSITWHSARTGDYRNLKFNIIEC